jgi:hypothetical protein
LRVWERSIAGCSSRKSEIRVACGQNGQESLKFSGSQVTHDRVRHKQVRRNFDPRVRKALFSACPDGSSAMAGTIHRPDDPPGYTSGAPQTGPVCQRAGFPVNPMRFGASGLIKAQESHPARRNRLSYKRMRAHHWICLRDRTTTG